MTFIPAPGLPLSERELAELERSYLRDLQDIAAARASCASLRAVVDHDERVVRRELTRLQPLLQQAARARGLGG